ncbi:hypothetical protein ATANTOWER_015054 [Ataeniobius toweri]|uniref:Uncharacterized protein n=1 Tax=Ataeniobius toweri TaxID=208326 RepID=A0ABU7BYP9_9TELE|nr:hypothetical protein [Ataeniobius toweri]
MVLGIMSRSLTLIGIDAVARTPPLPLRGLGPGTPLRLNPRVTSEHQCQLLVASKHQGSPEDLEDLPVLEK